MTIFSIQREIIITSLFKKLTKVSTNNSKIDINGISNTLEMCKNIISANFSLFFNKLEMLSHVVEKQEAMHRLYLNSFPNDEFLTLPI